MKYADLDRSQLAPQVQTLYDYAKDDAPTKSGSLSTTLLKSTTWPRAFQAYVAYTERVAAGSHFGPTRFYEILSSWGIRPIRYDEYACPHCFAYDMGEKSQAIDDHMQHVRQSAQKYREVILGLPEQYDPNITSSQKFVLILIDYCRIHELGTVGKEKRKVSVFNITIVLSRSYQVSFDWLATAKQSYEFMATAFEDWFKTHLVELGLPLDVDLVFWSDGGLRNYGTIDIMTTMAKVHQRYITVNFFPSYHGHSRCDAHFGYLKMSLRRQYPTGGLISVEQVMDKLKEMKNTKATLLDSDLLAPDSEVGKLANWKSRKGDKQGVKSFNVFLFSPMGEIFAKRVVGVDKHNWYKKPPLLRTSNTKKTASPEIAPAASDLPSSSNSAMAPPIAPNTPASAKKGPSGRTNAAKKGATIAKRPAGFPAGSQFQAALRARIAANPEHYRAEFIRNTGRLPSIDALATAGR